MSKNDGHNHSLPSDLGCLIGFAVLALIAVMLLAALAGCKPADKPSIRPDRNQPTPTSSPMSGPGPDGVYYASCAEAKSADVTPLHKGDPGYREALDKDHDGIACDK